MLFILSNSFNPFFNLAAEEYLLKNFTEEIFMLWRSEPSIVIGKHQNTHAEINYRYVKENNINVARRLSGGGTVVHDMQNLNFTFIANGTEGKLIDFKKFISPVISFLSTLGISSHIGEKNDIRIGELKISGNAEHVYRKRVLHHGTLLFNSDLTQLSEAIKVNPNTYFDKAVQSNRSTVTNIIEHLHKKISIEEFTNSLADYFTKSESTEYSFTPQDLSMINKLILEKYSQEEWIYSYSPKYRLVKDFLFDSSSWNIDLSVEKGIISKAFVAKNEKPMELSTLLCGLNHMFEPLYGTLKEFFPDWDNEKLTNFTYQFF
jgi:lipoate---protein ligase